MSERIFEGSTVEDALARAAAEMDLRVEQLEHEVLEEGGDDFWGLDEPVTRVKVWRQGERPGTPEKEAEEAGPGEEAEQPERAAQPEEGPEPAPKQQATVTPTPAEPEDAAGGGFWSGEAPEAAGEPEAVPPSSVPRPADVVEAERGEAEPARAQAEARDDDEADVFEGLPEVVEDPVPEIEELMERIFAGMDFECGVKIEEGEETINVMVSGADKDYLVESGGKGLSAVELILNHSFRHRLPKGRKIRVDAGDFRSRREDELRDLAFQVAHSAKQSGDTQETQPLNPYERRLVHLALADDGDVSTRSRGSGFLKHVQIIPRRGGDGRR